MSILAKQKHCYLIVCVHYELSNTVRIMFCESQELAFSVVSEVFLARALEDV